MTKAICSDGHGDVYDDDELAGNKLTETMKRTNNLSTKTPQIALSECRIRIFFPLALSAIREATMKRPILHLDHPIYKYAKKKGIPIINLYLL